MKKKVWDITVKDNPNRVVMGENDEFYTTDTEAFLVFNLQDKDFQPQSAMLTLENRNDGSLKSEEVSVVGDNITWEMPERYIEHSGNWQAQLVYEQMKDDVPEKYTSGVMAFTVNSHIKDKKKPSLVEIENWEKFIREGTELIETWEDMEELRQANYQELLDTGVLQTNINNKLEQLEEEYAPTFAEVTAQLAQNEQELKQKPNRNETGWADLNTFDETTRSIIQGLEPGDINAVLGEGNVKPANTTFFKHGKNLFNKETAKIGEIVNHNTGRLQSNGSFTTSDYMRISGNSPYTFIPHTNNKIVFYDKNKEYISGIDNPTTPVMTPGEAHYAIISFVNNLIVNQQFELGNENTAFESYIGWYLDIDAMRDKSVPSEKLDNLDSSVFNDYSLPPEKMTFFISSKNLYNKESSVHDKSVNTTNGSLRDTQYNIASDYIEVEPNEYYTLSPDNGVVRLALYNQDKVFISGLSNPENPVLTPENARFVRYSYVNSNENLRQFEKGQEVTDYEPYRDPIFDVDKLGYKSIPINKLEDGGSLGSGANSEEIIVDMQPNDIYFYIKGSNNETDTYLKYQFVKETREFDETRKNGNLNAWRLQDLYEVTRTGEYDFVDAYSESLTTNGVWEFAIKEKGKTEFMGGAHGNEVMTLAHVLFDGVRKELGTAEQFKCKNIRFTQKSTLYRVFEQTPLAEAVKVYDINAKDKIKLSTTIKWLESVDLDGGSYLPMLPIKRHLTDGTTQITDRFTRDSDYEVKDVSTSESVNSSGAGNRVSGVETASIWGEESGISAQIDMLETAVDSETMFITSSNLYNKFYYLITGGDYTTDIDEKMKVVNIFKLNTIN